MATIEEKHKYIRKPSWIRSIIPTGEEFKQIRKELSDRKLNTVCAEADCPNLGECWSSKTATMMILGDTCTRACRFCNVKTGNPKGALDRSEITNASEMVGMMSLKYLVLTSVDRDDLEDYGAQHFAEVVNEVHKKHPDVKVEVLVPDFQGVEKHMKTLAESNPFVIAQNIETIERLTHPVRDKRAGYNQTLKVLEYYKENYPHISTKTSIMVGIGETTDELVQTMKDLRTSNVDIVTFGQYLQPSRKHLPVLKYYTPEEFEWLKTKAYELGFKFVASGPMVRSSYKAADYLKFLQKNGADV